MAKVIVVYDTKYGNTKLVAEKIVEGLNQVEGIEAAITDVESAKPDDVSRYDAILIGSPNHMGNPARSIVRFVDELGKFDLGGKKAAVFDTYLGKDYGKVVKKIEDNIRKKTKLALSSPGLSIKVDGMKGPVSEGELPKSRDFGVNIGNQLL